MMVISSKWLKQGLAAATILMAATANLASAAPAEGPKITKVSFSGSTSDQTVTITGTGFGAKPPGTPCNACETKYLLEYDGTSNRNYGFTGDGNSLNIISWTDTRIVTAGLAGDPGDTFILWVWNARTKKPAAWGGNIPGQFTTPKIKSLVMSGSGANLHITVEGNGFGAAPSGVPGLVNTYNLEVCDLRPINAAGKPQEWCAGFTSDLINLNYSSWTNTKIVIFGFGTNYGLGNRISQSGDPVTVRINTTGYPAHGTFGGPQTAASAIAP
jgi:IPT/TIG domain